MKLKNRFYFLSLSLALVLGACGTDDAGAGEGTEDEVFAPPLTSIDVLKDGAPDNSELRSEGKADAVYPPKFTDLLELQSPVRDQARRGVCSIFATIGLMEHLYIKEGTYLTPDFSEQYLQWSAKNQVGSFKNTEGSTGTANLNAITRYGIVEEALWPYETSPWTTANDSACTGDNRPTRCYTNGEPPQAAKDAEKFTLPSSRWLSTRTDDIKAYMTQHRQAVTVGFDFFYQSWNHGASKLPINREYSRMGYVLYPNSTDKTESLKDRAGHAILLVGWDDTFEVQRMDENGKPMVDANGEPMTEKGFYIFKNSWGTGSFGTKNPYGDGYGFISQKYIAEYGSAQAAEMPVLAPRVEICGDGIDNDNNGLTDCEDAACADHVSCQPESNIKTYSDNESVEIPDNDADGIERSIDVADEGLIASLALNLDITHPFQGDLNIVLENPQGDLYIVADSADPAGDFSSQTLVIDEFNGTQAQGTWTLHVWDDSKYDSGTLNSWTLEITY